ncbi:HIT domain-containing protein [Dyella tabacisoli]|uniref:HIT domain-containing protein n=1 Tax=Dyella tabacisoli TaxID=2282381 RepID=A0A369URQ8_9GAMM|nr:HIT family protein [Dyella tabacisoli]RDD83442.1 HIT domain-containing protein [Dyella tabacisoli]
MKRADFILDPRLQADTRLITSLALCDILLMNDTRFPWLILVPRRGGLVEVDDLGTDGQALLWHEVHRAAAALRNIAPCDKLNIGALGNIVRQLHVHVVARRDGDAAWPAPVWGSGAATPYPDDVLAERVEQLRTRILN